MFLQPKVSKWIQQSGGAVSGWTQQWMQDLFYSESLTLSKKTSSTKAAGQRLLTPDEDIKQLMMNASSLQDIWQFFLKRLNTTGAGLDLICLSVLDESGDFIRVKYLYPVSQEVLDAQYEPIVSMSDRSNHLVQAYQRRDTAFTPSLKHLGAELETLVQAQASLGGLSPSAHLSGAMHIFSVPFIASDKTIAMMTLGFGEMDAFSQAKLSYVYTLRDQIAQLVWNLVLKERMKSQAQIDNLTGLLTYSSFQRVLETELDKASQHKNDVTVMILDINNIHQINEQYGHPAGDAAICHLASTIRRLIRGLDTVARYAGDDIIVLLPETDHQGADEIGERFLQGIKSNLPKSLRGINLSLSIGHATYCKESQDLSDLDSDPEKTQSADLIKRPEAIKREELLKLAEQALHLAQFKGAKTGESTRIASSEIEHLNDKTVLEVFASRVAKKYNDVRVPSLYQDLLAHFEKKSSDFEQQESAQQAIHSQSLECMRNDLMLETITSLACALDAKDRYTRGHSQAVANYAVALAHALKLPAEEVEKIRLAAFLHDIGKIGIPEAILLKEGPLTEKELEIMKQHPVIGAEQILAPVTSLRPIIPAVLYHHENWDGTGYPHGLAGEDIPLGARIVSLVDVFHALTSDRSYRKALPVIEAKKILEAGSGSKWDPHLIDVFFQILTIASPKTTNLVRETVLNSPLVRDKTATIEQSKASAANNVVPFNARDHKKVEVEIPFAGVSNADLSEPK